MRIIDGGGGQRPTSMLPCQTALKNVRMEHLHSSFGTKIQWIYGRHHHLVSLYVCLLLLQRYAISQPIQYPYQQLLTILYVNVISIRCRRTGWYYLVSSWHEMPMVMEEEFNFEHDVAEVRVAVIPTGGGTSASTRSMVALMILLSWLEERMWRLGCVRLIKWSIRLICNDLISFSRHHRRIFLFTRSELRWFFLRSPHLPT